MYIKTNDVVQVIAGREIGKTGRVLRVDRKKNRVFVEGLNVVKRHKRPSPGDPEGGIQEREAWIHASNVLLYSEKSERGVRVRLARRLAESELERESLALSYARAQAANSVLEQRCACERRRLNSLQLELLEARDVSAILSRQLNDALTKLEVERAFSGAIERRAEDLQEQLNARNSVTRRHIRRQLDAYALCGDRDGIHDMPHEAKRGVDTCQHCAALYYGATGCPPTCSPGFCQQKAFSMPCSRI